MRAENDYRLLDSIEGDNKLKKLLSDYTKLLLKKWILWIFTLLDIVALIIQATNPQLQLPQIAFLFLSVIGLFWAGFEVYKDTIAKIPVKEDITPSIKLALLEGNEYSFDFAYHDIENQKRLIYRDSKTKTLPVAKVTLHLRIENTGLASVEILNIDGRFDNNEAYDFHVPDSVDSNNNQLSFPITIEPKNIIICNLVADIRPNILLTDAQLAARTHELVMNNEHIQVNIHMEMADNQSKRYHTTLPRKLSMRPLCDLYITYWQSLENKSLAKLATNSHSKSLTW